MKRELEMVVGENGMHFAIFNSNDRREKWMITMKEYEQAADIIGDNEKEEVFCQRIISEYLVIESEQEL